MFPIKQVLERKEILPYLKSRNILKQYQKAKNYLLSQKFRNVNFKKRQPKADSVWYFRINKQYRAIGYFDDDNFIVVEIDNHQ
jgi:plasmid maintenance system killer protein